MAEDAFHIRLEGGMAGLPALMRSVGDELSKLEVPAPTISKYVISVEEMVLNTLKHGRGEEDKATVQITGKRSGDWVELSIRDNALPFDPITQGPEVQVDASLEERKIGGLGIHLVKEMMDEISYKRDGGDWNHFTMRCRCA